MRWVSYAVSALLVTVVLSGCADEPVSLTLDEAAKRAQGTSSATRSNSTTSSTSPSPGTPAQPNGTGNATAPGGNATPPPSNQPPAAALAASPANGSAPLNVTFRLTGTDADGDALSWTLDFGDGNGTNGTALPADVAHAYPAAGNYTARLTVSDGKAQATAEADVAVAAGAAAAPAGPNHCNRTPTQTAGVVYVFEGDNGNWVFAESNGVAGLQVGNNHPTEEPGLAGPLGEHNTLWEGCEDPDQMLV